MYTDSEFTKFIHYLTSDYNVILSVSPNIKKNEKILNDISNSSKSNEINNEFIGNKRIRQITSPSSKSLNLSPFNKNTLLSQPNSNSAFKNLNPFFSSLKKTNED
jgi:hypothetical protein